MERNSYLISRAFRNYLWASLLSSACMQLTVMADAMVAGHFIGPDALTAINLAMPLVTLITALSTLIGVGPAIMAAKAIGSRNTEMVNSIFSSAIMQVFFLGTLQAVLLILFLPKVGGWLCTSDHLMPYLMEYLKILPFTFFFLMLVFTLVSLIEADGKPKFATKAVAVGSFLNVVMDVVLVKFVDMGVRGLACSMLINYLSVTLFFLVRMRKEGVSYHWVLPRKSTLGVTVSGLKEGMPMMVNDILYSLLIFGVNTMLLTYCGETELYYWAVFLQLLYLIMVIVDCAEGAILSIGSVLEGENDRYGLKALVGRLWWLIAGLVFFVVVVVWAFPDMVERLFSEGDIMSEGWPQAVRRLSLMLVPYALTTFMRSVFQVLGNRILGVVFSLVQFLLMTVVLFTILHCNQAYLWWSFPIASWMLFFIQMGYIWIKQRQRDSKGFNIVPMITKENFLELSVAYKEDAVVESIERVCNFLQERGVKQLVEMEINICCEELMLNIVRYQTYKTRSYMDLSVTIMEDKVFVVLKDSGRPFNPVLSITSPGMLEGDVPLGLYLVNSVCTSLNHQYMYGLNVVFAEFSK